MKINNPPPLLFGNQTDMTLSRNLDTPYRNVSHLPMLLVVGSDLGGGNTLRIKSDANAAPVLVVCAVPNNTLLTVNTLAVAIILPGNYYQVSGGGANYLWVETV